MSDMMKSLVANKRNLEEELDNCAALRDRFLQRHPSFTWAIERIQERLVELTIFINDAEVSIARLEAQEALARSLAGDQRRKEAMERRKS